MDLKEGPSSQADEQDNNQISRWKSAAQRTGRLAASGKQEIGTWFTRMTDIVSKRITVERSKHRLRNFVSRHFSQTFTNAEPFKGSLVSRDGKHRFRSFVNKHFPETFKDADPLKGSIISADLMYKEDSNTKTFFIKAVVESSDQNSADCYLQLEKVYSCKECATIFDDANEVLTFLMETKTERTSSGYCCIMCKTTTSCEEDMTKHLQSHLESNEVTCEECEEMASETVFEEFARHPEKNLEKVRVLQMIVPCKNCSKVISNQSLILPEVMTADYDFKDTDRETKHTCCDCNCDLHSANSSNYKGNIIAERQPICKECQERCTLKERQEHDSIKSRTSSIGTSSMSSRFDTRQPPTRRHIIITNINEPLQMKLQDFIAEHTYSERDVIWYTCRFCGQALTNVLEMTNHLSGHILFDKRTCKDCKTDV